MTLSKANINILFVHYVTFIVLYCIVSCKLLQYMLGHKKPFFIKLN